ncbi:hypothetical protein [Actinacidiphila yeochonensis]|uniref:hypothetical protein n=1 Tax=Actinacidiphila yeochonensis TaxID=89050 RepID=UPI000A3E0428|nr:hypothetical protein [Actinacidiphila yeochonensis]
MAETTEIWVERIKKLDDDSGETEVRELVHEVYETAQKDLDAQRAIAEFEREE